MNWPKRPASTTVLYVGAIVVALSALAFLITNVIVFKNNVAQYVAQGYAAAEVIKGLLPGQLLPGVFEPIAVYGGIALLLFAAGGINQKVSLGLEMLSNAADHAGTAPANGYEETCEVTEPATDEQIKEAPEAVDKEQTGEVVEPDEHPPENQ